MSMTRSITLPPARDAASATIRLYVPEPLAPGATVALSAGQAHYLATVMRRAAGDPLRVFNGADGEHGATIGRLKRDQATIVVGEQLRAQAAEPDIWLCFALLKRTPTDLVVQKATELGASVIQPVFTTRTNADRTNIERLRSIAIEAAEQCERLSIPALHPPRALSVVLAAWPADRRLAACLERVEGGALRRAGNRADGLLIGPEGGFTDAELDALRACPFVEVASLGQRILRAETAAIVGLALMQAD